jgi:enamine deaminase RidA (YjgF/YER057c/UK114 family)
MMRKGTEVTRSRQSDQETQKGDVMTDRRGKKDEVGSVRYVDPEGLHKNPAFTNAVVVEGPVRTVYVGGQNAVDASGNIVGKGDIAAQTEQVLANVRAALAAGGAEPEHVIKWNLLLVEGVSLQEGFSAFQRAWVATPNPPAITAAFVAGLAHPDFLLEMDAIAVVPQ